MRGECALIHKRGKREDDRCRREPAHPRPLGNRDQSPFGPETVFPGGKGRAGEENGPHALASLRNLTLGLLRLKNVNTIKETTERICRDRMRALQFMTT